MRVALQLCFSAALLSGMSVNPGFAQSRITIDDAGLKAVSQACGRSQDACVKATRDYLNLLRNSNLSAAQYNDRLTDLVVALATTAQEGNCGGSQVGITTAISLSGTFSVSAAQRQQIDDIAQAVSQCQEVATAALTAPAANAGPAGGLGGGGGRLGGLGSAN